MGIDDEYNYEQETTNRKDTIIEIGVFIIVSLFTFLKSWNIPLTINNSFLLYIFLFIVAWYFFKTTYTTIKHKSPKFIAENEVTTISGIDDIEIIPGHIEWAIVPRDGLKAAGFYWKGRKGITIVPRASLNVYGMSVASTMRVETRQFDDLPSEVRHYILANNINPPYRLGLMPIGQDDEIDITAEIQIGDERFSINRPSPAYFSALLTNINRQLSDQDKVLTWKFNQMDKIKDLSTRLGSNARELFGNNEKPRNRNDNDNR